MTLRIYVAGSSRELERVRAAQRMAERLGCVITHDWTRDVEVNREAGIADADLPKQERMRHAWIDMMAIDSADIVWVLAPETQSTGCWVELGVALVWPEERLALIVSGPGSRRSIFASFAEEYASDLVALLRIRELVSEHRGGSRRNRRAASAAEEGREA